MDVENAAEIITAQAHPEANITWGVAFDSSLTDEIIITVIATGFDNINNQGISAPEYTRPASVFGQAPAQSTTVAPAPVEQPAPPPVQEDKNMENDEFYVILNDILNQKKD